jgi:hypothetical protein
MSLPFSLSFRCVCCDVVLWRMRVVEDGRNEVDIFCGVKGRLRVLKRGLAGAAPPRLPLVSTHRDH